MLDALPRKKEGVWGGRIMNCDRNLTRRGPKVQVCCSCNMIFVATGQFKKPFLIGCRELSECSRWRGAVTPERLGSPGEVRGWAKIK